MIQWTLSLSTAIELTVQSLLTRKIYLKKEAVGIIQVSAKKNLNSFLRTWFVLNEYEDTAFGSARDHPFVHTYDTRRIISFSAIIRESVKNFANGRCTSPVSLILFWRVARSSKRMFRIIASSRVFAIIVLKIGWR